MRKKEMVVLSAEEKLVKEIEKCENALAEMETNNLLRHVYMAVRFELIMQLSEMETATNIVAIA